MRGYGVLHDRRFEQRRILEGYYIRAGTLRQRAPRGRARVG